MLGNGLLNQARLKALGQLLPVFVRQVWRSEGAVQEHSFVRVGSAETCCVWSSEEPEEWCPQA